MDKGKWGKVSGKPFNGFSVHKILKICILSLIIAQLLLFTGCRKFQTVSSAAPASDLTAWVVDWGLERGLKEWAAVRTPLDNLQVFAAYFNQGGKLFLTDNIKALLEEGEKSFPGDSAPYLTVVNDLFLDNGKVLQKDPGIVEDIIKDEKRRKDNIEDILNMVSVGSFEGVCLDYQNIPEDALEGYAEFISDLGGRLAEEGKELRVVLEPGSTVSSVSFPQEYEYTVMAYNLHGPRTDPGPKADREFIESLCDKTSKNLKNVRLAFSLGGFDWPEEGEAAAVTQLEAEKLLDQSGSEAKRSPDSEAAYFNYRDHEGVRHTVYYADTQTLKYWIKTAQDMGINKFALWKLGGNNIETLSQIRDYIAGKAPLDNLEKKCNVVSSVVTDRKVLSMTFNGLPDEEETKKILDELGTLNIKATFFLSGIRAGEEQETLRMIVERGHELGNSTLTGVDLTLENYEEKIRQISKSHDAILKFAGTAPKYLRPGYAAVDEGVRSAAAESGYDNIVTFSVNPQDWQDKTPEEAARLVVDKRKKGGIIILNADKNPRVHEAIPLIYQGLKAKGYELIPLQELIEIYEDRKENQHEPDDDVKVDPDYKNTQYRIIQEGPPAEKDRVALTFDDWGTDDTIDGLLDVLDRYDVKATFFLRAKGVESNPSLAYAISQRGHEIANHTYSHTDLDQMTPMEIQEDIVKAHKVIAEAINKEPARYLRPPRGVYNPRSAEAAAACGYSDIIMYSITSYDWKPETATEDIVNNTLENSFDGAIILLHMLDGINTTEALPLIIEGLREKGYTFVTVGEMLDDK